jgi:hypothetical protein
MEYLDGFKVCVIQKNGRLCSVEAPIYLDGKMHGSGVYYKIGKETFPNKGHRPLTVFTNIHDASKYSFIPYHDWVQGIYVCKYIPADYKEYDVGCCSFTTAKSVILLHKVKSVYSEYACNKLDCYGD